MLFWENVIIMTHLTVKMLALKENIWEKCQSAHLHQQIFTVQALILYNLLSWNQFIIKLIQSWTGSMHLNTTKLAVL